MADPKGKPVVSIKNVTHRYGKVMALDGISLDIPPGLMVGIVGPDGVGKSTLMGIMAGSKMLQEGEMTVLDGDIGDVRHRRKVCPRIAYMPQGLGKNLYLELSVRDNVDFMAQLFGLTREERPVKVKQLLDATGLGPEYLDLELTETMVIGETIAKVSLDQFVAQYEVTRGPARRARSVAGA